MTEPPNVRLVVGLANPGSEYAGTRHNIGGDVVASFMDDHSMSLGRGPRGIRARTADGRIEDVRVTIAVPTTFMNESGQAVAPLAKYFSIDPTDLLVVHDDIDLAFGKLKVQWAGGHGGNNGVRSVAGSLGSPDFWRLKIGVGRPPGRMDAAAYVLQRFSSTERDDIDATVYRAADIVKEFVIAGGEEARQRAGEINA